ncbi:MAG: dTDP-4-dehydrorhamnose 3,5-epimerase [Thermodesulfobacteriota bacterium]
MKIVTTDLPGVLIIEPRVFRDARGFFLETYQAARYADAGIDRVFVQDNLSFSVRGTLRGLHYQIARPQAKLVQAITGAIFDVAVDIRRGSPTFGRWVGVELSAENRRQLFIPEGFAHGFCVLSDTAYFSYKCADYYAPDDEGGVLFSDPALAVTWPVAEPVLSSKDQLYPCLAEIAAERLPVYRKNP